MPPVAPHVLAHQEDPVVAQHLLIQRLVERLGVGQHALGLRAGLGVRRVGRVDGVEHDVHRGLRALAAVGDGGLDLVVHGLRGLVELVRREGAFGCEALLHARDGVAVKPGLELVLGPGVAQVDAERVLAVAVGHRLDQGRPLAGAGAVYRLAQYEVDLDAVVAVHGDAGDLVGGRAVRDLGDGRGVPVGRGERVLVVLADEDYRQLPHRREVERFVEDALIRRAVAEEGHRHPIRPLQLGGEAGAGGERHGGADDAVGPHDVELHVRDVHGAAEALTVARLAAHQLRHHAVDARALGNAVAVTAVVGGDDVVIAQRRADAGGDRLLALVAVGRALDDAFLEEVGGLVLEGADAAHGDVEVAEGLRAHGDIAGRALVHLRSPPWRAARAPAHCSRLRRATPAQVCQPLMPPSPRPESRPGGTK